MAKINADRLIPIKKGEYDPEDTYRMNHIVSYNGAMYWHIGMEDTTGVPPTDEDVWCEVINLMTPSARAFANFANVATIRAVAAKTSQISTEEN